MTTEQINLEERIEEVLRALKKKALDYELLTEPIFQNRRKGLPIPTEEDDNSTIDPDSETETNSNFYDTSFLEREEEAPERGYMENLMEATNTYIQWPSRMKIGAKTKKDLFVRIYGHNQDEVNDAKLQVLQELGPHRDLRITLKMEISYTDHSHLIGCRGATIRKVMEDTGCHIHFPDSNRMSKEHKSNQVTIAGGSIQTVEQARTRVRELSPLIFQFNIPILRQQHYDSQMNPDAHNIFIDNLQTTHNVQVTVHPPNKLQQTTVSVKGCEVDSAQIRESVSKIISYFAPGTPVQSVTVESTMEISSVQHGFVRAVNDSNVHSVMMNTGANVIFPDLSDHNIQQIKRSRIYIAGDLNSVYNARQQLIGCLPLRMIFDLADDFQLDWEAVQKVGSDHNVNVKLINRNRAGNGGPGSSLPPPIPGRSRTIQLIAAERNASNIFEVRRRILGALEPVVTANIPLAYTLRSTLPPGSAPPNFGPLLTPGGPLPPLMLPQSPNVHSPVLSPSFWPPTPFSSPFCSPSLANCGLPNGPDANGQGIGNHGAQRPRQFNMHNNGQMGPMGRYGMDAGIRAERSPEFRGPVNLMPEFDLHHHRRAPGFERSNTLPNSQLHSPEINSQLHEEMGPPRPSATQDKKLLAMKAMYQAKMGNGPRIPNSEWSGYGFSKTHMNLFPTQDKESSAGADASCNSSNNDSGVHEDGNNNSIWTNHSGASDSCSSSSAGSLHEKVSMKETLGMMTGGGKGLGSIGNMNPTKKPLGPQASNLLDFAASRASTDVSARDLTSLFIQHGLEKYIDGFLFEEIDMDAFSLLTETDLRSLGVSSYPARKRMLLLIAQLSLQQSEQLWN